MHRPGRVTAARPRMAATPMAWMSDASGNGTFHEDQTTLNPTHASIAGPGHDLPGEGAGGLRATGPEERRGAQAPWGARAARIDF